MGVFGNDCKYQLKGIPDKQPNSICDSRAVSGKFLPFRGKREWFTPRQLAAMIAFFQYSLANNDSIDGDVAGENLHKIQSRPTSGSM
jgi:hypothetical protein